MTEQLLDTSLQMPPETRRSSNGSGPWRRTRHEEGAVVALEPNEPARRANGQLRRAVVARASIRHPNLVPARVIGEGDGRVFVALARCGHPSLSEVLAAGPLEPAEAAVLLAGAAAAVDALSQSGLVARDLTPDRVMVDPVQGAVLMDLGIAPDLQRSPLEQAEDLSFCSPEELAGEPVDARSSVYALGAILSTALERVPRSGERGSELSPALEAVISRATAADPAERYPDAQALSRAFTAAAGLGRESLGQVAQTAVRSNGHPRKPRSERTAERVGFGERTPRPPSRQPRPRPARRRAVARARAAQSALRRGVAAVAVLLAVAVGAARHGWSRLHRLAVSVAGGAKGAARWGGAARLRGRRWVLPAVPRPRAAQSALRRGVAAVAVLSAVAGGAARQGWSGLRRLAVSVAEGAKGAARLGGPARLHGKRWVLPPVPRPRAAQSALRRGVAAVAVLSAVAGAAARQGWSGLRRLAVSVAEGAKGAARLGGPAKLHGKRWVLPAAAAIVASALSGIALGRAVEPDKGGPSSLTRSGLTVQLPAGWEPARIDPARGAFSPAIAAAASDGPAGGFVVGKLSSQTAAEQVLERSQSGAQEPTQVRLGTTYAWRYAGLRPRPRLVAVGFVVPAASGAVVMLCHASKAAAAVRLAECGRAAATLVVPGAPTHRLPFVDRLAERLKRVVAALRVSRSHGLRRLAAAKRPFGQARAATSLERSHERAAESLDRLDDGSSPTSLTAALRAAADAYGRLSHAAETGSRSAYRDARRAVARDEQALRRELSRADVE